MDSKDGNAFIITLGPPQKGKRERISQVRSHIAKRYYQRRNQTAVAISQHTQPLGAATSYTRSKDDSLRKALISVQCSLPPEIACTILSTNHPMLNSGCLLSETTRRMQKFLDIHIRLHINGHPFLRNVITWSITFPHFASAKLLNASGWDDIEESGELSPWTRRQRFITIQIMNDQLKENCKIYNDATIASIQSLLGFEVLTGGGENYLRLRRFSKSIIEKGVQWDDDLRVLLTRFFFLLDHTNQLCMASNKTVEPLIVKTPFDTQFSFPVDFALFTFGHHCPSEGSKLVYSLLGDLYSILFIAESLHRTTIPSANYEYIVYQRERAYHPVSVDTTQENMGQGDDGDIIATPIRVSIVLLTTYLLSGAENLEPDSLAQIASYIRTHLSATRIGIEYSTAWIPFPGALLWLYAIGVRFAGPKDKMWFLMQFLRVSHREVFENWDEASKSILLISKTLGEIHPVCIDDIQLPSTCLGSGIT